MSMSPPGQSNIHAWTAKLLGHFEYEHLPPHLQIVSQGFHALAHRLVEEHDIQRGDFMECQAALRHLLEAKDCAVRCVLTKGAGS